MLGRKWDTSDGIVLDTTEPGGIFATALCAILLLPSSEQRRLRSVRWDATPR